MLTPSSRAYVGVEGVLGVDERRDPALALRFRDDVQAHGRLARTLGTEDLDDPAARDAADAERDVERQRARSGWWSSPRSSGARPASSRRLCRAASRSAGA